MSKFDLPDLPSDDELGLSKEEIAELEKELDEDGPEMSAEELEKFLSQGTDPSEPIDIPKPMKLPGSPAASSGARSPQATAPTSPPSGSASPEAGAASPKDKKAEKTAKAAAKRAEKTAKAAAKKAAKQTKAAAKEAAKQTKVAAKEVAEEGEGSGEGSEGQEKRARPAMAEEQRTGWRGAATLVAMIVVAVIASSRTGLPSPVPANAPPGQFSSARAMTMLVDIASEAHPPGSPAHSEVRDYLVDRLTELGLEPEVQTAASMIRFGAVTRVATVRNVVARLPGTASTGAVVATAHYDSREIALGAGDDGSGVVSILEALRVIRQGEPLRNDLIILLTDAEELGLLGARSFVDEHPWMDDVRLALSFEMRGGGGPGIMFETNELNGWVVRELDGVDPHYAANSMSYEVYRRLPNDTDFSPFRDAGVQGLNFGAIDNAHVYHQEFDAPQNLDESTLQDQGLNALSTMRHFGNADLTEVNAPNVVYFTVPLFGMIVYDAGLVFPISAGVVLLWVLGLVLVARGGWGIHGTLVGLGVSIVTGTVAYFGADWLVGWLQRFHPEAASLHGSEFHSEGWYLVAIVAGAFTLVTLLHGVARRWVRAQDLALGAALLPMAGAVAVGVLAPLAAMNLQWPVAAALLAVVVTALLGDRATGTLGWVVSLALAAVAIAIMTWMTELLWIAMSIRLAGVLAVLAVVTFYLTLPAMDGLRHPNSWWAPAFGVVACGASLGLGILASRSSPEHPAPTTLLYAYEHGDTSALWVTSPVVDSVDLPARAWAIQRTGQAFPNERDMSDFGYRAQPVPVASAPVVEAETPGVRVENDVMVDGVRRVVLSVRSRIGAEMMAFSYPDGGRTRLISLNAKRIEDPEALQRAEHWGTPDPAVFLELHLPPDAPIELVIVEHLFRPEELLGPDAFDRPEEFAPDITRMSDRAMLRYVVPAEVDVAPPGEELSMPTAGSERPPDPGLEGDTDVPADTTTVGHAATDTVAADTTMQRDTIGR